MVSGTMTILASGGIRREHNMDNEYYIVMVQDIGEVLEYEYDDYDKAAHLMEVESLTCSLWVCSRAMGRRVQIDFRKAG